MVQNEGQYMAGRKQTVSDTEILEYFADSPDPVLGTAEIAELLDFSKQGARKRLYALAEKGLLNYKRVGGSPAFWLTAAGEEKLGND